jgi:hypothetical protein
MNWPSAGIPHSVEQSRRGEAATSYPENQALPFDMASTIFQPMSAQAAFHRGVQPLLQLLLPGREDAVLAAQTDHPLRERIDELAAKNTEGLLAPEERDEYAGYVRANKFVAVLRREAKKFKAGSAA